MQKLVSYSAVRAARMRFFCIVSMGQKIPEVTFPRLIKSDMIWNAGLLLRNPYRLSSSNSQSKIGGIKIIERHCSADPVVKRR